MPWIEIINSLFSLGDHIIGSSDKLKNQKKDKLIRTADALEAISNCINDIIEKFNKRDWQGMVMFCEQLGFYLQNFNKLNLGPVIGEEKIGLLENLEESVLARKGGILAKDLYWSDSDKFLKEKITILEKTSGKFKAAAIILRATA